MIEVEPVNYADMKREVPEGETRLASDFLDHIDAHYKDNEERFKSWEQNRKYWRGTMHKDGAAGLVRTNVIFSTMSAILPQIYAKAPDISCSPAPSLAEAPEFGKVKKFAETMEGVLHAKYVREGGLKRRGKEAVRATMATGISWAKVVFREDVDRDPLIEQQLNDIQDNLKHVQMLRSRLRREDSISDNEKTQEELKQSIRGLAERVEVVKSRGIIIDRPLSEDIAVLDSSLHSFDAYVQSPAIAQRIWFDENKFEKSFGFKPEGATQYDSPRRENTSAPTKKSDQKKKWYCVFEVWSKDDNTVYTLCKGLKRYIREPYRPHYLGERWYPFFALGFNLVDGEFYPMSDVELLIELQDEYNTTRTNFADHRKESLPVRIARAGGGLSPEDLERIQKRKINDIVVIQGAAGKPLTEDLFEYSNIPIDPAVYDTQPIRSDIDLVSGATDASRGAVVKAKTATEAEILQQGMTSRTSERQDAIEDWIGEQAIYCAEMLLQKLPLEEVQQIVGPDAVWPQLSKEQVFSMIQIEVRGGSTGKPNAARDQERWLKLMPIIQDAMLKVAELRAQGQNDMADAVVELVRETLNRFDERIDLSEFIPPAFAEGDPMAALEKLEPEQRAVVQQVMQQGMQQLQMLQQQNQELQQQLQQATDVAAKEQVAQQAKGVQADADRQSKQAIEMQRINREADVSAQRQASEHERSMAEISSREALERDKIASNERIAIAKAFADASAKVLVGQQQAGAAGEGGGMVETTDQPPQPDVMAAMEALVAQMQAGFAQLASAISQPMVPTRGPDGLIQMVGRVPPKAH